jgi:D-methionine transport system substrate-binding protein
MKKLLSLLLALALSVGLVACGDKTDSEKVESRPVKEKIIVGASPSPHAEILRAAKDSLAQKGYELEIVEFTDYVIPNNSLEAGELDANFFQHTPYLDSFNAENGTHIVPVAKIHFEPLGLYPGKSEDIKSIKDGATIALPNDTANEARALLLLQDLGIITLKKDANLKATVFDIEQNPHNVKILEIEAAQTVNVLPDVDFAVINGNYAVSAGISEKVLASESADGIAPLTYANVLAVRREDKDSEKTKALVEALTGDEIRDFINEKYKGLFVRVF